MLRRSPPNRTELNAKAQRRKGAKSALRSSEAAWRGRCPRRIGSKHHRSASASMVGFKSLLVPLRGTPASAPARKRRPTAQSVTSLAIRSETGGPRSGPGGTAIRGARCLCRASGAPLHPSGCTPLEPVSLASNLAFASTQSSRRPTSSNALRHESDGPPPNQSRAWPSVRRPVARAAGREARRSEAHDACVVRPERRCIRAGAPRSSRSPSRAIPLCAFASLRLCVLSYPSRTRHRYWRHCPTPPTSGTASLHSQTRPKRHRWCRVRNCDNTRRWDPKWP
jgi:hypothetical protein